MSAQGNSLTANWGLVPLRLVVGLVFIVHGGQKLFVFGLGGAAGFMAKVGIPWPFLAAVVVIAVEILGGLALILGLAPDWRRASWPLIWSWPSWPSASRPASWAATSSS